jgi:hypothetical protein
VRAGGQAADGAAVLSVLRGDRIGTRAWDFRGIGAISRAVCGGPKVVSTGVAGHQFQLVAASATRLVTADRETSAVIADQAPLIWEAADEPPMPRRPSPY